MLTKGAVYYVNGNLQKKWNNNTTSTLYYIMQREKDHKHEKFENDSSFSRNTINVFPNYSNVTRLLAQKMSKLDLRRTLNERIDRNEVEPLLTLFTTWNDSREKYLVHNLTVRNWSSFRPFVIPVIFTNDALVASECQRKGWNVLPIRVTAADGIPVLKFMYEDVMAAYNTTFYAYSNSDILYTDTLIDTLASYAYRLDGELPTKPLTDTSIHGASLLRSRDIQKPVLIIGKRTNVKNVTENEGSTWKGLTSVAQRRGQSFTGDAEDYFITPRNYPWKDIAEVVIGLRAYDNWIVYYALKQKYTVIDATSTLLAVHQTTRAGNYESSNHKNKDYDAHLLVKMYKDIKFNAGRTDCAEYHTKYVLGCIIVMKRTVPKSCSV